IVPVGCNGSDGLYPGASPFSSGGKVVYRIGAPIRLEGPELAPFRVTEPFHPFTLEAGIHREAFQGMTDVVMDHINELLDEPYQYGDDHGSDGVSGMDRFVAS
ncbi:MAG: hypothetical protein JRG95_07820, partial [Deltaproteobacteria bacterium]|nr:hypothetical protein [Deltaproteobacteria bacterium]